MSEVLSQPSKLDLHQRITDEIVRAIEAGADTFTMPWHTAEGPALSPLNAMTGEPYHGVNVLVLWSEGRRQHRTSRFWATYRQWQQLDCKVQRGERAATVVYYKRKPVYAYDDKNGDEVVDHRLVSRAFFVFNANQVDGWSERNTEPSDPFKAIDEAEKLVWMSAADIRHGGDVAFYSRGGDYIRVPEHGYFTGTETMSAREAYYATVFHELIHWTAPPHRLGRVLTGRFGDMDYAMEELVAELGAAYLCAECGVSNVPRPDHAAYLAAWLKVLKGDKRAIFAASAKASEAVGFLQSI